MKDAMWERAQAALDARRDPLRDAELTGAPEELAELVALRAVLATLERPRRRRRLARLVAAAALLLGAVGALALRGAGPEPAPDALAEHDAAPLLRTERDADAPRPAGRVLALSMTTITRSAHETRVARSDGRTLRRELRAHAEPVTEPLANSLLATHLIATVTR